jgi:hypothetical protein
MSASGMNFWTVLLSKTTGKIADNEYWTTFNISAFPSSVVENT